MSAKAFVSDAMDLGKKEVLKILEAFFVKNKVPKEERPVLVYVGYMAGKGD